MLVEQLIYFSELEDISNTACEGLLIVQIARPAAVMATTGKRRCKRILSGSLTCFNLPTLKMIEMLKWENKYKKKKIDKKRKLVGISHRST